MTNKKKRARTRKEMFDALSPEEQEEALQEMTWPYPLKESVELDVAKKEMDRRHGRRFKWTDDSRLRHGDTDQSGKEWGHDHDRQYKSGTSISNPLYGYESGVSSGHQDELEEMLEDQAARLLVDAVKEKWSRKEVAEEINKNPALPEGYFKGHNRGKKKYAGGSELSKKVLHYNKYPEGKYRFGKDQLPDWAKEELIEEGYDLEAPLIKSAMQQMTDDLRKAGLIKKRPKRKKSSQAEKNRAAEKVGHQ